MRVILIVAMVLIGVSVNSCGSSCGLELKQRLCFPQACDTPTFPQVTCCGASLYQDFNLTADDVQIDLINSSGSNGRVDAFLVDGNCTKLFSTPYAGVATSALCTIYIGPVSAGVTSQRKPISRGMYRVFEQAYATNTESVQFLMEAGLWSDACRWSPVNP